MINRRPRREKLERLAWRPQDRKVVIGPGLRFPGHASAIFGMPIATGGVQMPWPKLAPEMMDKVDDMDCRPLQESPVRASV